MAGRALLLTSVLLFAACTTPRPEPPIAVPSPSPPLSPEGPSHPADILRRVVSLSFNDTKNTSAVRADNYFVLGLISERLPLPEVGAKLRKGKALLTAHPGLEKFSPNFARVVNRSFRPLPGDLCVGTGPNDTDCMVLQSLFCDVVPPTEQLQGDLGHYRQPGAYDSGHATSQVLLGWWLIERNGCLESGAVWREKNTTAEYLAAWMSRQFEARAPTGMDSWAEAAAYLKHLALRPDLVQFEWEAVIWKDLQEKAREDHPPVHTTLLEILAVV